MTVEGPRLIEVAFPLKQTSLDSVHEKNVRHGHISTLHIWPARRPLAACRAALIATLLPDPADPEERRKLLERLGGRVVQKAKKRKLPDGRTEEQLVEETEGGILHWGQESSPDVAWFREQIWNAHGGRAPRVLDPFAGGGAIPLEAMRLGCEATAIDINPVAWFILKCTLEYPQKLAGQKRTLPTFVLESSEFMAGFFKRTGAKTKGRGRKAPASQAIMELLEAPKADLAWHVRAWGRWVMERARADLERFYPIAEGKPAVAYFWARTATCKNTKCRAAIPLLRTRWLCKKDKKRVLLTINSESEQTAVTFRIQNSVPHGAGSAAQRKAHDKELGQGTIRGHGPNLVAVCPMPECNQPSLRVEDLRREGRSGSLGTSLTAVVVEGVRGKEYRLPTDAEIRLHNEIEYELASISTKIPFGLPDEPTPGPAGTKRNSSSLPLYGLLQWRDIFTPRQLLALCTFVLHTRRAVEAMNEHGYPADWTEAISAYLYDGIARLADRNSQLCTWQTGAEKIGHTFARFALPITWDFVEVMPWADASGGYLQAIEWVAEVVEHVTSACEQSPSPDVRQGSAISQPLGKHDIILTDPPYYDAILYADMMDFFYVWLRRTLYGTDPELDQVLKTRLAPKWDKETQDGELVDDPSRFDGDFKAAKYAYEEGMFHAFESCGRALDPNGRLVVVFANKQPDAWETLVSALIRAGFVVNSSWPIETERKSRTRSLASAALSTSVWLVCKQRPVLARPGWDNRVLEEMREHITVRLREFWDAGTRGPDFVWAAMGPGLEAFSQHPVVKKANEPGQTLSVPEFLRYVRRMVVDFVVGRVLAGDGEAGAVTGLDDVTAYYLLHRHDFGMADAPVGASILYAMSCGLSDTTLADQHDVLVRMGGQGQEEEDEGDEESAQADTEEPEQGSSSKVRLRPWNQRRRRTLGYEGPGGQPAPLIDQVHKLMQLWKAGDLADVNDYLGARGLRGNSLFHQLLQALVELATAGSDERALLEALSNHLAVMGVATEQPARLI